MESSLTSPVRLNFPKGTNSISFEVDSRFLSPRNIITTGCWEHIPKNSSLQSLLLLIHPSWFYLANLYWAVASKVIPESIKEGKISIEDLWSLRFVIILPVKTAQPSNRYVMSRVKSSIMSVDKNTDIIGVHTTVDTWMEEVSGHITPSQVAETKGIVLHFRGTEVTALNFLIKKGVVDQLVPDGYFTDREAEISDYIVDHTARQTAKLIGCTQANIAKTSQSVLNKAQLLITGKNFPGCAPLRTGKEAALWLRNIGYI